MTNVSRKLNLLPNPDRRRRVDVGKGYNLRGLDWGEEGGGWELDCI